MKMLPLFAFLTLTAVAAGAGASPIVAGFNQHQLSAMDDGFALATLPTGLSISLAGATYLSLFVNNNGSVSTDFGMAPYSSTSFASSLFPSTFFAPFLADVDTSAPGSGLVSYGAGQFNGYQAFGVTWAGVGYFPAMNNKLDTFQLIMVNRSDTGSGNVDIYYNYGAIAWDKTTTGPTGARVGYSQLGSLPDYELAGSGQPGAFLDGGIDSLVAGSNIGVAGSYEFSVRNGEIIAGTVTPPSGTVPLPGTLALFGIGAVAMIARRRQQVARQRG